MTGPEVPRSGHILSTAVEGGRNASATEDDSAPCVESLNPVSKGQIGLHTADQSGVTLVNTLNLRRATPSDRRQGRHAPKIADIKRPTSAPIPVPRTIVNRTETRKVLKALEAQDWSFTHDDTRYLTHDLHPYPAKFIPQLPAHLIATLSDPGDVVFDPFGGSATTAVEAVRLGRRAISLDANPLSEVIGRVKTGLMTPCVRSELERLQVIVTSYLENPDLKVSGWADRIVAKHNSFVPDIPNIEKWFARTAVAELVLLRFLIDKTTLGLATAAALLALSRIVVRVSYQESETRYVAAAKKIPVGFALCAFLESLRIVVRRLEQAAPELQRVDARFIVADARKNMSGSIGDSSVDLIVTSPPYSNSNDYHLYHRFRLFWLGFDPRELGAIEVGSHLRHQRNGSGFDEYREDMASVLRQCHAVLRPGRYAVFVVGDALFKGKLFSTSDAIITAAKEGGFEFVGTVERPIHQTKRSFAQPARRARKEFLVILRKAGRAVLVTLLPPAYRMWGYEVILRRMEIETLSGQSLAADYTKPISMHAAEPQLAAFRRLTFTREYLVEGGNATPEPTWQRVLENGDAEGGKRKDPKYATHGLHPYKGKFYPQLAKALMNVAGISSGARVLDPFCGSGTVLVEGMLNGFAAFGCDMNPLAAKIARAKTGILALDRAVTEHALRTLLERLGEPPPQFRNARHQFSARVRGELERWFAPLVLDKLDWTLAQVRRFNEPRFVEFCEVALSSIIRDVSHQDPSDLRIRRRKSPLTDAPVVEMLAEKLTVQLGRLVKYWSIAGRQPGPCIAPAVREGDCRNPTTFQELGLESGTIDCVVTSPPYATALPYIDTDRLSLMAIMGVEGGIRIDLEENLTGSREIRRRDKENFEQQLMKGDAEVTLPKSVVAALRKILRANRNGDVGFRRDNMPALLWRYFCDMRKNLSIVHDLLRPGARAFYVVGDSRTKAGDSWTAIETCRHVCEIAEMAGLEAKKLLDISVTTESYKHIKNAITENAILEFRRPLR